MSKFLITKDYERFVFDALSLNETDFVNYYLNIFAEHFKYNSDIFEQLETVINRYIDWYKSIVYGRLISVTWYDGTEKIMYENQTWSKNESGEIKMHDLDKTQISLIDFKINRQIDKSFFDKQIKIIHDIEAELKKGDSNKFIFDILHYLKLENNDKKRVYVNSCIAQAGKISDEQYIKECDFIILKIREYCSIMPLVNGVPDVTQKMIEKNDALILNYVLDQRKNKSNFLEIENKPKYSGINHEIEMSIKNIITPELEKFAREITNGKQQVTSASKSTGTKKEITSFESTLTEPQLKILYDGLRDGKIKFIHSETDFKQFTAIFENKPTNTIKPVKWLKNKPQLFCLLNYLIDKNKITEPESLYNLIEKCFFDKHGKPFQNLKQSYNTFINVTENIRFHDTINDILLNVLSA